MRPRHVITALALLFFLAPLGLRAVGVTARPFENRPMAPKPSPHAGWDVFDQTTRFFTDRMPLREQAVRAQTWAARHVLDVPPRWRRDLLAGQANTAALPQDKQLAPVKVVEDPAAASGSRVVEGKQGWLFLEDDLQRACSPALGWPLLVERLERLAKGIRSSGRDVVVAIAPDKSTVYPGLVGDRGRQRYACAEANRRAYWPLMERSAEPGLLPLRQALLDAKGADELYRSTDSHWNTLGGSVAVRAILDRLDAGVRVAPGEIVTRPPLKYTGDLNTLLGIAETSTTPDRAVVRRPGAPKLGGETLFICDSYGLHNAPLLVPYAEKLTQLQWPIATPDAMIAAVERADHVIIQIIEREVPLQFLDTSRFALLLRAVEAGLKPRSAPG